MLGQLVAAYEHRVFTQGVVWGINSFDQWGVELGKVMANQLAPRLQSEQAPEYDDADSSTNALVRLLREGRGRPARATLAGQAEYRPRPSPGRGAPVAHDVPALAGPPVRPRRAQPCVTTLTPAGGRAAAAGPLPSVEADDN